MHKFIDRMALRNSVNASIQRGMPVYMDTASPHQKNALKEDIKGWLQQLGKRYIHWQYDHDSYFAEIEALQTFINAKHGDILTPGMITLGVAQKCVSLYLKYLWLLGHPEKMPQFPPIDGRLMSELGITDPRGFKQITTREQVAHILTEAEQVAQRNNYRSAVIWEADWWSDTTADDS